MYNKLMTIISSCFFNADPNKHNGDTSNFDGDENGEETLLSFQ